MGTYSTLGFYKPAYLEENYDDEFADGIDAGDAAIRGYMPLASPGSDHTANGPKSNDINAGMTVSAFDVVRLASDGKWDTAKADAEATVKGFLAIALEAGSDGNPLLVARKGSRVRDDSWNWTPGDILYISAATAGLITATAPGSGNFVRIVGYAETADVICFDPDGVYIEVV